MPARLPVALPPNSSPWRERTPGVGRQGERGGSGTKYSFTAPTQVQIIEQGGDHQVLHAGPGAGSGPDCITTASGDASDRDG